MRASSGRDGRRRRDRPVGQAEEAAGVMPRVSAVEPEEGTEAVCCFVAAQWVGEDRLEHVAARSRGFLGRVGTRAEHAELSLGTEASGLGALSERGLGKPAGTVHDAADVLAIVAGITFNDPGDLSLVTLASEELGEAVDSPRRMRSNPRFTPPG